MARIPTTVHLPEALPAAAYELIQIGGALNFDDFLTEALSSELCRRKREATDSAFAEMASDSDYQAEVKQMMGEFGSGISM